jgi:hypothetical protein
MREMSDAMPDPRLTTSRRAAAAREADAQCRGIGPSGTPDSAHGGSRGRGVWPTPAADAPVARPVVGAADGHVVRSAITQAATEAVMRDAAERAATQGRPPAPGGVASSGHASADQSRLLDALRTAVARYVCERRRAGAPIERVLPEVKGLVREASAHEGWHDRAATLMEQVVGWTIATYYGPPEQPREPWQDAPHVGDRR